MKPCVSFCCCAACWSLLYSWMKALVIVTLHHWNTLIMWCSLIKGYINPGQPCPFTSNIVKWFFVSKRSWVRMSGRANVILKSVWVEKNKEGKVCVHIKGLQVHRLLNTYVEQHAWLDKPSGFRGISHLPNNCYQKEKHEWRTKKMNKQVKHGHLKRNRSNRK